MQAATEVFPGWIRIRRLDGVTRGRHVRRFHDWKGGADVGTPLPLGATLCARVCGRPSPGGMTRSCGCGT